MATLKSQILREVGALARCIQSLYDVKYRQISLHRGQFIFLTRVCEQPGINLAELSNLLKVDKTTTTKAVAKLETAGYVTRGRDGGDRRMWRLSPTAKASAVYPYIIAEENRSLDTCLAGFTAEETGSAAGLLARMRTNIEKEWQQTKTAAREETDE